MNTQDKAPRWATKAEAAEYARCSERTIAIYIADGLLSRAGHGRRVTVDLNELDAVMLEKKPYKTPWLRD